MAAADRAQPAGRCPSPPARPGRPGTGRGRAGQRARRRTRAAEARLSEFQQRRRLQLAIERLPDEQRLAMLLRLEHDLDVEEIAQVTGVSRETVKSRLRYATRRIREELSSESAPRSP
ncbi:sigma-70 family RNA polymerase sigma factor [Bordetella pertussis]|uniref:sigma-70 family RNA polymerase sigma factor n=1 Tax=Bordetella pertussis TaxID=520 RepID=UPI00202B8B28|nr:sigma-70 family RNA polymerase sigma factor [Bordetella pertussis]